MKILINGSEESLPLDGETLEDILNNILTKKFSKGSFLSKLKINENEIPVDSKENQDIPLSDIEQLEVEISSLQDIVDKNLSNATQYLEKLIPGIEQAAQLFRAGSEQEANQYFVNVVDGIDWFSEVVTIVIRVLRLDPESAIFNGESFRDRQEKHLEMSRQLLEANQNKDWVLLADLLEYEILPFYREWNDLLPQIPKAGS